MRHLYPFLIIIIFFSLLYFFFIKEKGTDFVQICQNREISKCKIADLAYNNPENSLETRVTDLLERMTLEEKIGQMMLIERKSLKNDDDIALYGLGGLLSGMGSKPKQNTPEAWRTMIREYTRISRTSRLGIPIIYGVDAIHGHANLAEATIFPHAIGLGASHDPELVRRVALATSEELADTGIFWNFSPNLDVLADARWGRFYESFSSDPELVTSLGRAYIEGVASYDASSYRAMATAKHYIGAGAMEWGSSYNRNFKLDQGESKMTLAELRERHLPPFQAAVEAGVSTIMVGLNSWENKKLSANRYLITDVLRGELGFEGLVISDWYAVYEIETNKYQATVTAINAGIDMVMLPFEYKRFMTDMELAVKNGDISEARIDEAVKRILNLKFKVGLFDKINYHPDYRESIGSKEHRALAREAVSKSIVLLKGDEQLLTSLAKSKKIYLAGSAAHNLGRQLGAWSVEWQGIDGNWTKGSTIYEGIKELILPETDLMYEPNADFKHTGVMADLGIVVVGEEPYAEGWGDSEQLTLTKNDLAVIKKVKEKSKKIMVVIISGRPLDIKQEIKEWDLVLAAWLPGSEGAGLADIIFGRQAITARLPVIWELD